MNAETEHDSASANVKTVLTKSANTGCDGSNNGVTDHAAGAEEGE